MVDGHIQIADGLRLHALCGIDDEQRALTGGNASRHLVREIDVARRVYQVEQIFLSLHRIFHLDGVALDGDAALTLQIHVVQHLTLRDLDGLGALQQTVGQGALAVIDMGYDAKIPYMVHSCIVISKCKSSNKKRDTRLPARFLLANRAKRCHGTRFGKTFVALFAT